MIPIAHSAWLTIKLNINSISSCRLRSLVLLLRAESMALIQVKVPFSIREALLRFVLVLFYWKLLVVLCHIQTHIPRIDHLLNSQMSPHSLVAKASCGLSISFWKIIYFMII